MSVNRQARKAFEKRVADLARKQRLAAMKNPDLRPVSRIPYVVRAAVVRPLISVLWLVCELLLQIGLIYTLPSSNVGARGCKPWELAIAVQGAGLDLAEWARAGKWPRPVVMQKEPGGLPV